MQIKTTVLIPKSTFKQLKYYSGQKNKSMSSIITEAVEEKIGLRVANNKKKRQGKFTTYSLGPDTDLSREAIYDDYLQNKFSN